MSLREEVHCTPKALSMANIIADRMGLMPANTPMSMPPNAAGYDVGSYETAKDACQESSCKGVLEKCIFEYVHEATWLSCINAMTSSFSVSGRLMPRRMRLLFQAATSSGCMV